MITDVDILFGASLNDLIESSKTKKLTRGIARGKTLNKISFGKQLVEDQRIIAYSPKSQRKASLDRVASDPRKSSLDHVPSDILASISKT